MAEFLEVMTQFDRMCKYYHGNLTCPMDCPMDGVNISQCRKIMTERPEITEKTIMAWAREHPEPVYPTWWKYMCMIGVIPNTLGDKTLGEVTVERLMHINIPADIAEKLGLDPVSSQ